MQAGRYTSRNNMYGDSDWMIYVLKQTYTHNQFNMHGMVLIISS